MKMLQFMWAEVEISSYNHDPGVTEDEGLGDELKDFVHLGSCLRPCWTSWKAIYCHQGHCVLGNEMLSCQHTPRRPKVMGPIWANLFSNVLNGSLTTPQPQCASRPIENDSEVEPEHQRKIELICHCLVQSA